MTLLILRWLGTMTGTLVNDVDLVSNHIGGMHAGIALDPHVDKSD